MVSQQTHTSASEKVDLSPAKLYIANLMKQKPLILAVETSGRVGSVAIARGEKILADTDDEINIDMKPKFLGRHLTMVISPLVKSRRAGEQESKRKTKK